MLDLNAIDRGSMDNETLEMFEAIQWNKTGQVFGFVYAHAVVDANKLVKVFRIMSHPMHTLKAARTLVKMGMVRMYLKDGVEYFEDVSTSPEFANIRSLFHKQMNMENEIKRMKDIRREKVAELSPCVYQR